MARKKKETDAGQTELFEARVKTAPCVPRIKEEVRKWAEGVNRYAGVTDTTRTLLEYWFHTDHEIGGKPFKYYTCQREAIETLVYLFEVKGAPLHRELLETYASEFGKEIRLLQHDDFARYCLKMATGSGKTMVMALAIAWQFLNAMNEGDDRFAKTFLILAPNIIVLERLKSDFAGGLIFKKFRIIPKELRLFWPGFDFYMRGDSERTRSEGVLYLTNIQQFYERPTSNDDEPDPMKGVMGEKPPAELFQISDFDERIVRRGDKCMVLNDEAHHTHDEDLCWNEFIRRLSEELPETLSCQLDFTATPRYQSGMLFTWTIYDYPLKQAMIDGIVKTPIKGIASGFKEAKSDIASKRFEHYLVAAVERWIEYKDQLSKFGKKPILFIMMNLTKEADDVGDWLRRKYPEHFEGDKTLVIHTNRKGEVSKKDEEIARKTAREVDDEKSEVNAIVSVMMLREGWDVQNVTVILGLRPYSSKARILPEQTIGRGLRLMFRGYEGTYNERVDILGHDEFLKFINDLEKDEDIALGTFNLGEDKLNIVDITPVEEKIDMDIELPILSPLLARRTSIYDEIAAIDVSELALSMPFPLIHDKHKIEEFRYEGFDVLTMEKLVDRIYQIKDPQTPQEVISYYAKRIAHEIKLPSSFSVISIKVKEFLEQILFGKTVDLSETDYLRAISSNTAQHITVDKFVKILRPIVIEEVEPLLESFSLKLSEMQSFPYSWKTMESKKCVFNLVPCQNDFELAVARFFDKTKDVERFASLPRQIGFTIRYTDSVNNLRRYNPDFVLITTSGISYLIETKGREDIDVRFKDEAAERWCIATTNLTGREWRFLKIPQKTFEAVQVNNFSELEFVCKETG